MDGIEAALTLSYLPQLGPARLKQVHQALGPLPNLLDMGEEQLIDHMPGAALCALRAWQDNLSHPIRERVQRDLDRVASTRGVTHLCLADDDYPHLLYNTSAPPPILSVRGSIAALELPQIAMVGTRRPTVGGSEIARDFARYLAASGFAVTSGLALGIDACAHRGALDAKGVTLAVLGSGIDRVYPARNRALAEEIVDGGGALVSEFLPGTAPEAKNFPRRNRVISGLSLGTMVVEAAIKSGSLITARYALEQEREVFAVPGSIHNPMSRGCHSLINSGAKLVECAQDIIEELGAGLAFKHEQCQPTGDINEAQEHWLLQTMGYDPVTVDHLCSRSGAPAADILTSLIELELHGAVEQRGSYYCRVR
ncbi:DNA-processing protein DprA [Gilvimarinus sp. SDUM040013]|uniref:DNA-processing protein DprA n=1 Tax=Gilvimarinus gilvus TaxID=3058038 RepID=A0ABU4RZ04_9GAMM|nr:DNA-processing protein DprA [Gilvimarinus sp. SDUM040013]MDO3387721.1 DNA-processing protein DprA [Gilvimarinus sp. SDUM040013]MDX6848838.1 DNA-processing protein DprA [Gilvimarinus sp. SDUM040013]